MFGDFIAGGFSGIAQTIVGHPFDTIKVNIQNGKSFSSVKPNHYFRGITFPLVSNAFINSIVFSTYQSSKKTITNYISPTNIPQQQIINAVSGTIAGFTVAPFMYIFDYGKTIRQMGERLTLKHLFMKKYGFKTTIAREMLAFNVYFTTYDYIREHTTLHPLYAGGISGLTNWGTTYWLDVIRNRQIYQRCDFKTALQQGALYKGFSICAIRAIFVNSLGFYVFEIMR